jgi:Ulp1 family protease
MRRFLYLGLSAAQKQDVFIFSSFFYKRLFDAKGHTLEERQREGYKNVKRWTKGIDNIFMKKYVLVPVNYSLHWSLAIICNLPTLWHRARALAESPPPRALPRAAEIVVLDDCDMDEGGGSGSALTSRGAPVVVGDPAVGSVSSPHLSTGWRSQPLVAVDATAASGAHSLTASDLGALVCRAGFKGDVVPGSSSGSDGGGGGGGGGSDGVSEPKSFAGGGGAGSRDTDEPCIIFFDSLACHDTRSIGQGLTDYLTRECDRLLISLQSEAGDAGKYPPQEAVASGLKSLVYVTPRLPRQQNSCDCGVYVLEYSERFLLDTGFSTDPSVSFAAAAAASSTAGPAPAAAAAAAAAAAMKAKPAAPTASSATQLRRMSREDVAGKLPAITTKWFSEADISKKRGLIKDIVQHLAREAPK